MTALEKLLRDHGLYATAVFDILGGLGVLLPAVARIKPL